MSNATAKIDLNISEGMIADAIAVAIAEAFSPEKKDQVLRDIVRAHLAHKANSYDRDTMLSKAVGDGIRSMASEAVKAKIESMREDVYRVVDEEVGPKFRDAVLGGLKASLAQLTISNICISAQAMVDDD